MNDLYANVSDSYQTLAGNVSSLTTKPPLIAIVANPSNSTLCYERPEMFWLKLALLASILICLILLLCTVCISSICYISTQAYKSDTEVKLVASPGDEDANAGGRTDKTATLGNDFRKLTIRKEDQKPTASSSSISSPNVSTFSTNLAPPSPTSIATNFGMASPEETMVKKLALDRLEQEEARRHTDLMLLADRHSTTLEPAKAPTLATATTAAATKNADYPRDTSSSKGKKKRSRDRQSSEKFRKSGNQQTRTKQTTRNPSFTVDTKTNQLIVNAKVDDNNNKPGK